MREATRLGQRWSLWEIAGVGVAGQTLLLEEVESALRDEMRCESRTCTDICRQCRLELLLPMIQRERQRDEGGSAMVLQKQEVMRALQKTMLALKVGCASASASAIVWNAESLCRGIACCQRG